MHLPHFLIKKFTPEEGNKNSPCFFPCPIYNGQMLEEEKKLKDSTNNLGITIKDSPLPISYTKTNKLITALYMVTDMLDENEPLRNKLRTLGTEIISDIHSLPARAYSKIAEIMSFLDIASAINIISPMNCNILKKEFLELKGSIQELTQVKPTWLEEFFIGSPLSENYLEGGGKNLSIPALGHSKRGELTSKGHTRIGVQKGSTLLKALSRVEVSEKTAALSNSDFKNINSFNFDILKKQRRNEIISLITKSVGGATITDIRNGAYGSLISCSEKTLQRELLSMVKDGVLNKTGEKRWSRYFSK